MNGKDIMRRIVDVRPSAPSTLHIRWSDGSAAAVDLAPILQKKPYIGLRRAAAFEDVELGDWGHSVRWKSGEEIGADSLWLATLSALHKEDARSFLDWRLRNGLSLNDAADALGLSRRMIAYYSNAEKPVPRHILLACEGWEVEQRRITLDDGPAEQIVGGLQEAAAPTFAHQPVDIDPLRKSFEDFASALRRRFELAVPSSEDSIRYTYFHFLLADLKCGPERLVLEHAHSGRHRALVDTWVMGTDDEPAIALEFKFHRPAVRANSTMARTMNAGAVVADIFKLAAIDYQQPLRRIMVYVSGSEMSAYFRNNDLAQLFDLPLGTRFNLNGRLLAGRPLTFIRAVGEVRPASATTIYAGEAGPFQIRAFEVRPNER